MAETTLSEYADLANSEKLVGLELPVGEPFLVYCQDPNSEAHKPGVVTGVEYVQVLYKSSARGHDLNIGYNVDVKGYLVAQAADGSPQVDEDEAYVLITQDAEGNDIEPHSLMQWRPYYGADFNKRGGTPRDVDTLILLPGDGVPMKKVTRTNEKGEESKRDYVAWELIPNLENLLKKPILNVGIERLEFVDDKGEWLPGQENNPKFAQTKFLWELDQALPATANAPSRRAKEQKSGGYKTLKSGASAPTEGGGKGSSEDDPFDKDPSK